MSSHGVMPQLYEFHKCHKNTHCILSTFLLHYDKSPLKPRWYSFKMYQKRTPETTLEFTVQCFISSAVLFVLDNHLGQM